MITNTLHSPMYLKSTQDCVVSKHYCSSAGWHVCGESWVIFWLHSQPRIFLSSPQSVSPPAARSQSGKRSVSRLPCASRRGTAKYAATPGWRRARSATPGSSTSMTTPAARTTANSNPASSAGTGNPTCVGDYTFYPLGPRWVRKLTREAEQMH